jgi:hypothetical protein
MSAVDTPAAFLWPANTVYMTGLEVASGTFGVVASSISVGALLGELGGVLAGLAAIAGIVLSVATGNARRRRQYEDDIRAAFERGRAAEQASRAQIIDDLTEARRERDEYHERYLNLLENRPRPPRRRGD